MTQCAEMVLEERTQQAVAHVPGKATLNMREACSALGCSENHVRHLVEEGSLLAIDVACKGCRQNLRINRESLANFIKGRVQ